jgi:hypothetical protein
MNTQDAVNTLVSNRPIIFLISLALIISIAIGLTVAYVTNAIINAKRYVPGYIKNSKTPTILSTTITNADDVKEQWFKSSFMLDNKGGKGEFVPVRAPTLGFTPEGEILGYVITQLDNGKHEWTKYTGQPIEWSTKHKRYFEAAFDKTNDNDDVSSISSLNDVKPSKKSFFSKFKKKKKIKNTEGSETESGNESETPDTKVEKAESKKKGKKTSVTLSD